MPKVPNPIHIIIMFVCDIINLTEFMIMIVALEDFTKAIELEPDSPITYNNRFDREQSMTHPA